MRLWSADVSPPQPSHDVDFRFDTFSFRVCSRGGPHIHWRAAAARHDGALRTSLPCSPPWISMNFSSREVKTVTLWIILWGRNVPCGTGVHWGETMIDASRTQAPEFIRWDNATSEKLSAHTHIHAISKLCKWCRFLCCSFRMISNQVAYS